MNTSNITNYKLKDFAELLGVSVKTLQRWNREVTLKANRGDEEIAKELQDGNKSNIRAEN